LEKRADTEVVATLAMLTRLRAMVERTASLRGESVA
jgi:hypothetical protein